MTAAPAAADLARFRDLVERELGLRFDDAGRQNLQRALLNRLAGSGQSGRDYLDLLDAHPERERLALATELTIGETYFLRHIEQFQALTRTALPDLLRDPARTTPLRLLSAGCSTGEETYSLAIALRESGIGPDASILGVDVNPVSLARARSGRYTDWSLRSVPVATQERWFTIEGEDVVLDPMIRAAVGFEQHNFAQDDPGLWQPEAFDVVFCRNVIMYFTPEVMAEVVARIARSLVPGGYLFLGSAETLRGLSTDFVICESEGTFYYQRAVELSRPALPLPPNRWPQVTGIAAPPSRTGPSRTAPPPARVPVVTPVADENLDAVIDLLRRERFTDALAAMDDLPGRTAGDPEVLLLRAALLTHSGSLPAAERACRRLLEVDTRSAGAHVLLAMCREGEQDLPAAVDHCRTAITFDPDFAMPHVHLGRLARRMGDQGTARRQYAQSARLLPGETGRRILLFGGGFDREALISLCRAQGAAVGEERLSRHAGVPTQPGGRVAEMRTEFDSAFARLPEPPAVDLLDVLALRVGDEPCLLRLADIAEVIAHPLLTPVPTLVPALVGITVGRGSPIAAYDLGLLLGRAPVSPHWLVLAADSPGIGIVFEHFDGYRQASLGPNGSGQLIEMSTLIDVITRLAPHRSDNQENS